MRWWRARTGAVLAASLLLLACSPAPAEVTRGNGDGSGSTTTTDPPTPPPTAGELRAQVRGVGESPSPDDVLFVGDSVMVLVTDDVASRLSSTIHVDAADCRRLDIDVTGPCGGVPAGTVVRNGIDAVAESRDELAEDGIVPEAAVFVLANNSTVTAEQLDEAMAAVPDVERVWWVTPRIVGFGRQDFNNVELEALVQRDERARLIDWFDASEDEDWLADNVHPNAAGQRALGRLIAAHVACDCVP